MGKLLDVLNKEYKVVDDEHSEDEECTVETSTTADVASYNTPNVFGDDLDDDKIGDEFTKVKKTNRIFKKIESKSTFVKMAEMLNEVSYKDYKNDKSQTSKQKINNAIKEINHKMYEIERSVKHNLKLRQEDGVDNTRYWKVTKSRLNKISERMLKISKSFRDLSA